MNPDLRKTAYNKLRVIQSPLHYEDQLNLDVRSAPVIQYMDDLFAGNK